jgi:hypothetical protein
MPMRVLLWLTGAGLEGAGLGGVRALKSPPATTTIAVAPALAVDLAALGQDHATDSELDGPRVARVYRVIAGCPSLWRTLQ